MIPPFLRRALIVIAAAAAVFSVGGCNSSSYAVKVDSVAKRDASSRASEPQSYKINSKNPAVGDESLRYREAAEFVKTALSSKASTKHPVPRAADMIVELDYGIDAPRTKIEMVSVPRYVQVGAACVTNKFR